MPEQFIMFKTEGCWGLVHSDINWESAVVKKKKKKKEEEVGGGEREQQEKADHKTLVN